MQGTKTVPHSLYLKNCLAFVSMGRILLLATIEVGPVAKLDRQLFTHIPPTHTISCFLQT